MIHNRFGYEPILEIRKKPEYLDKFEFPTNKLLNNLQMTKEPINTILMNMPEDVYWAYKKDFQSCYFTVGNVCNANCFFCSQKWNPPGIIKDLKRFLTMEEVTHFTNQYLNKAICIGSACHVNSGEFFLHPHAAEILNLLAAKNKLSPHTPIFTNGMALSEKHIKIIKKLNLCLYLSLNTADITTRKNIMGGSCKNNRNAIDSIAILDKYNVDYHVWIIPLRNTLNTGNVENTIKYLKNSKMKTIVFHKPGYTKYTPSYITKELTIPEKELFDFALSMNKKYDVTIDIARLSVSERAMEILGKLHKLFNNSKHLNSKSKLFLCAETVKDILPLILTKMGIQNYKIQIVKSKVFGGNVDCAGLLLVEDYLCALKEFLEQKQNKKPEFLILPRVSFDINMEDLSMTSISKIENRYKIKLILV